MSEIEVDKITQKGTSGISITNDIKLSSDKSIKNAAGTALLTEAGVLDNVALGSSVSGFPAQFSLGAWGTAAFDTVYRATSGDLFVTGWEYKSAAVHGMIFYTDSSASPTTKRIRAYAVSGSVYVTFSCLVKKDDYWKVSHHETGSTGEIHTILLN
jgi:hypothetical protein